MAEKLSANEIVKALICCCDDSDGVAKCAICPFNIDDYQDFCVDELLEQALSLITRQQAKIEILSQKRANIFEIVSSYEKGRAEAIKEVVEIMKPWYKLLCIDEGDWCHQLDALAYNLTKEMAGDSDA